MPVVLACNAGNGQNLIPDKLLPKLVRFVQKCNITYSRYLCIYTKKNLSD